MNWTILISVVVVGATIYGLGYLWYKALVEKMKHEADENAHNLELVNQGLTSDKAKLQNECHTLERYLQISNEVNKYLVKMLKDGN
jgi:hypothetical protein